MACPLALILAATVLTVPTGNKLLANAARTSSPAGEAFWRAALPGAPMPEAIRELLHPHAADKQQQATVLNGDRDGGDDPPPMNFNYDDYRAAASRRNENAKVLLKHGGGNAAACSSPPTVTAFFLEDGATGAGLDHTVRAALEGSSFVVTYVCHATTSGPERATTAAGSDDSPVSP